MRIDVNFFCKKHNRGIILDRFEIKFVSYILVGGTVSRKYIWRNLTTSKFDLAHLHLRHDNGYRCFYSCDSLDDFLHHFWSNQGGHWLQKPKYFQNRLTRSFCELSKGINLFKTLLGAFSKHPVHEMAQCRQISNRARVGDPTENRLNRAVDLEWWHSSAVLYSLIIFSALLQNCLL